MYEFIHKTVKRKRTAFLYRFSAGMLWNTTSTAPHLIVVLILDVNSEIGAHVRSNLCYLINIRHLIKSRAVTNWPFLSYHAPSSL